MAKLGKAYLTGAALTICGVAGTCHAQSSVLLFGTLDEGINFTSNASGKHAFQMTSVDLVASRWGLKGDENLGGAWHAVFDIESGFNVESGSAAYGGRLFGYQSYIGMQNEKFGSVTLGRQFDSIVDMIGPLTANSSWGGLLFSHPLDNDNTDATWHASNSIKYTSAVYGGITSTAMYGFSNQPGSFAGNRVWSAGLSYTHETFTAAAAYADLGAPGTNATGAIASNDSGFVAENQKIWGVATNYGFSSVSLGAVYTHTLIKQALSSIYIGNLGFNSLNFDNAELNVRYTVTPAFFVGAMYTFTRATLQQVGEHVLHWNQFGVAAQYSLSKRTAVYAQYVYQKVSGGGTGTNLDHAYIPGANDVSSNSHQMLARVGLTHSF
ncbi:porin [Paraburkholderia sediminicola]|uniref:porin n=1 Tax=Paraburkholderia sediminicola TaxID=458836 RepID=UPI0038BB2224